MRHAFRAEWTKLMRRGALLGGAGTIVALTLLATFLVFSSAQAIPARERGPGAVSIGQLEAVDGLAGALGFIGFFVGTVSMVLWAQSAANEYGFGTLKVIFTREPRRLVVLAGKLAALALFLAAAVVVASIGMAAMASAVAAARGFDTSLWWTATGLGDVAAGVGRLYVTALMRGLIGLTLAVAFRAAAPAIGIGLAYTVFGDNLILLVWPGGKDWLPGKVLDAFSSQGTATLSFAAASLLVALYMALLAAGTAALFVRRDVGS